MNGASSPPPANDPTLGTIVQFSTVLYGGMIGVGALVCHYVHHNLVTAWRIPDVPTDALKLVALGGLGAGVLLIASRLFEELFPSFRALRRLFMHVVGRASLATVLYLALLSSVGEELVFRGALQPYAGIGVTSVLFGLLHLGPGGRVSAWSLWAFLAGLLLGWSFDVSQSLWPPVITHFVVNATSFTLLRRAFRSELGATGQPPADGGEPPAKTPDTSR